MATLKSSRQRDAVKTFLMTRSDHPTADVVYDNIRKDFPKISLGTVYRNLSLLADLGEVNKILTNDGITHFDGNVTPHDHFICRECGKVSDIMQHYASVREEMAAKDFGGVIESHSTVFFGICEGCLNNEEADR